MVSKWFSECFIARDTVPDIKGSEVVLAAPRTVRILASQSLVVVKPLSKSLNRRFYATDEHVGQVIRAFSLATSQQSILVVLDSPRLDWPALEVQYMSEKVANPPTTREIRILNLYATKQRIAERAPSERWPPRGISDAPLQAIFLPEAGARYRRDFHTYVLCDQEQWKKDTLDDIIFSCHRRLLVYFRDDIDHSCMMMLRNRGFEVYSYS
jgi:hypothetical protein